MPKPRRGSAPAVREPVQVYLAADDRDLLARLAEETGLSKAEILRREVRTFAREQRVVRPMLKLATYEVVFADRELERAAVDGWLRRFTTGH